MLLGKSIGTQVSFEDFLACCETAMKTIPRIKKMVAPDVVVSPKIFDKYITAAATSNSTPTVSNPFSY